MDEVVDVSAEAPAVQNAESDMNAQAEPQFGLIDIVEAFTALRHEYRSQVKETRELAEQLHGSTQRIHDLESTLTHFAKVGSSGMDSAGSGANAQSDLFTRTIVDLDIQLSRAVDVVMADDRLRRLRQAERQEAIDQSIAGLSRLSRWLAGPVIGVIRSQQISESDEPSTIVDGLSILLARLRQTLRDNAIERIETCGKLFDGETMKSIGVVQTDGVPAGHVAQQLSPAYVQHQNIVKFAEVRVAT